MDDDFGADDEVFLSALAASQTSARAGNGAGPSRQPPPNQVQQPIPQKVQQPTPQRLDRPPPNNAASGVKQPTPQALPQRAAGSSILVSPRQKGNPVLACLKSLPWEYSDIPADYGLGLTTCALFLSLKYHRLHPEYIYTRIRNLQGRYNLRVLLALVDIPNHEDSLRELAKTSLVNNVTLVLCWSAAEAARYLELYKSYEHASFGAIRGAQATSYTERLVEFATVPRAVNKADAVALVCTFGSVRAAVNADPETVGVIGGWGEKKVKAWCGAVEEPFRARKAAKRGVADGSGRDTAVPIGSVPLREMAAATTTARAQGSGSGSGSGARDGRPAANKRARVSRPPQDDDDEDDDDDDAELAAAIEESRRMAEEGARGRAGPGAGEGAGEASSSKASSSRKEDGLTDGVAAALARLRQGG